MLKKEEVAKLKRDYPKGTQLCLINMKGEAGMPPGCRGSVDCVDDIGQIHVKWENGSSLALNVEEDRFETVEHRTACLEMAELEIGGVAEEYPEDGQMQVMAGPR